MTIPALIARSKIIFIDTAPLIYFIEAHPEHGESVKLFFEAFDNRKAEAVSSVITLHEVLVKPFRDGNVFLAEKFTVFLKSAKSFIFIEISDEIAFAAARLRGKYVFLKLADSIKIATAIHSGADIFLPNDKQLKQLAEINVAVLDEYCHHR